MPTYRKKVFQNLNKKKLSLCLFSFYTNINKDTMVQSFQITKKQYNYLLPIFGNIGSQKMLQVIDRKIEKFFFIGDYSEYLDLLNRCKFI